MTESVLVMVESMSWIAVLGATLWGIASVLLSPCHVTSVPLLMAFLERLEGQRLSALSLSAWLCLGISLSLGLVAAVSLLAGRILGDLWGVGPWLMIAFLILAGLILLEAIHLPSLGSINPKRIRVGASGAVTAGGVLGITLGPCTFAFFSPLVAFALGSASLSLKITTLSAFVLAHLGAIWVLGLVGARVARWLSSGATLSKVIKGAIGVAAILLAVDLIITTP